jgi:hypothetical protein
MVGRGRDILERTLGKEGWQKQVEAMKDEKARFFSLSSADQGAVCMSEQERIPFQEALRLVREEETRDKQRRSEDPGNG